MKQSIILALFALIMVSCGSYTSTIDNQPTEICVWENGQWATDWMEAYVDYFENAVLEYNGAKVKDVFLQWTLAFVDDDNIPEMVLLCSGEAYGNLVLSYYAGKVSEWTSWRCSTDYIPRSGLICNQDGSMGEYWDKVTRLKKGQFT